MRRVLYGGGTFITGDESAAALLDYARTLAATVRADTIDVPALVDGAPSTVELVVGPASQLMSEPADAPGDLDERGFLVDIGERISSARADSVAGTETTAPQDLRFFDDL